MAGSRSKEGPLKYLLGFDQAGCHYSKIGLDWIAIVLVRKRTVSPGTYGGEVSGPTSACAVREGGWEEGWVGWGWRACVCVRESEFGCARFFSFFQELVG